MVLRMQLGRCVSSHRKGRPGRVVQFRENRNNVHNLLTSGEFPLFPFGINVEYVKCMREYLKLAGCNDANMI